ncbi:MAG: DUF3352 domain-containing protein [Thermomicrobiales bacterium]
MTRYVSMRPKGSLSIVAFLALLAMLANGVMFASAPAVRAADTPIETAALAPESTLVYLTLTFDTQSDQWQRTSALMQTLGLGSLQDLIASSSTSTSNISAQDLEGSEVGIVITNIDFATNTASGLSSLSGGLTSPTSAVSDMSGSQGVVAVINSPNPVKTWADAKRSLQRDASDRGVTVKSTDYEGVTIESIPADTSSGSDGTAQALVDDTIVVGSTIRDVQDIIDVSTGKTAPLSSTDTFKKLQSALKQEFLVFGFVNGPALEKAGMTAGGSGFESLSAISALTAFTAFVAYAVDEGVRFDSLAVNEDGSSPMPASAGFSPSLDRRVPSDTLFFVDGNDLKQTGVLDGLGLAIAQGVLGVDTSATPTASETQKEYETEIFERARSVIGFNLKSDLIDQLKGEYGLAIWGANLEDPSNLGILFESGVDNESAVQDVVSKISLMVQSAGSGQYSVTTKTVGNSTIQSIDLSSSGYPLSLDYGVVKGKLIISVGNGLDTFMAGPKSTLAESPGYSAALGSLPANPQTIMYLDASQLFPIVEALTGSLSGASSASGSATLDAGEACGNYSSQAEAQAELDAEGGFSSELDQDFDGQACEDYFATPEAAAAAASPTSELNYNAIKSFTLVTYEKDGMAGASALLAIG